MMVNSSKSAAWRLTWTLSAVLLGTHGAHGQQWQSAGPRQGVYPANAVAPAYAYYPTSYQQAMVQPAQYAASPYYNPYGAYPQTANRGYAYYYPTPARPMSPAYPAYGYGYYYPQRSPVSYANSAYGNFYRPVSQNTAPTYAPPVAAPAQPGAAEVISETPLPADIRPDSRREPSPLQIAMGKFFTEVEAKKSVPFWRGTNDGCWFAADYLVTSFRPAPIGAPLVTVGSGSNKLPGALGQTGTSVVFGNNAVDLGAISGVRLEIGTFVCDQGQFSLEWTGFMTIPRSETFVSAADGNGNPVIARPFFNVLTRAEDAFLISRPGFFSGNVSVENTARLGGMEVNARAHSYWFCRLHADALLGLRYAQLTENLTVQDQLTPIQNNQLTFNGSPVNAPNALQDFDRFSTLNYFIGPQLGGRLRWEAQRCNFDIFGKLAVGVTREQISISGATTLITPTGSQTATGGILAQQSNIGTFQRSVAGVLPEFGLGVGVDILPHVRARLGYSVLLWNRVARPGSQIDRNVNPGLAPGSSNFGATTGVSAPVFRFVDESFMTHFFNVGLEAHF